MAVAAAVKVRHLCARVKLDVERDDHLFHFGRHVRHLAQHAARVDLLADHLAVPFLVVHRAARLPRLPLLAMLDALLCLQLWRRRHRLVRLRRRDLPIQRLKPLLVSLLRRLDLRLLGRLRRILRRVPRVDLRLPLLDEFLLLDVLPQPLLPRQQLGEFVEVDVAVGVEVGAAEEPLQLGLGILDAVGRAGLHHQAREGARRERAAVGGVVPLEQRRRAHHLRLRQPLRLEIRDELPHGGLLTHRHTLAAVGDALGVRVGGGRARRRQQPR